MPAEPVPSHLPLLARARGAIIARRPGEAIDGEGFLADVAALAAHLPDPPGHALNLCDDRYLALVGFAAALRRGHVTLLSSDRSPHRLRELAASYPGSVILHDGPAAEATRADPQLARLPHHAVTRTAATTADNPAIPAERVAAIAFTSGSTGAPVPHQKPWAALVAAAAAAAERFGLRVGDGPPATLVATVPPQHMYGFETTLMLPLVAEVASYAGAVFYPWEVATALAAVPPRRILVTTPLQLRALVGSPTAAPLPVITAAISATAPLGADLAAAAEHAWGAPVLEIYGATEIGSIASRRTTAGPDWLSYPGIALRATPTAELAAVPFLPEQPLADEVALLPDGRFRLLGRRADIVKLAGKRTSLGLLNRILSEIEGVEDGVFLAPDDLEGNPAARLAAYVVAPTRSAAEIVAALRLRVEAAFLPRPVVMCETLPRDPVGKLSRHALAELRRQTAR